MEIINWGKFLQPYEQAVEELCLKFRNLDREFLTNGQHSPIESVDGRVKSIASILVKAQRKNIPYDDISAKIEDIAGVRVICRFVEDIGRFLELLRVRNGVDMLVTDERDYITDAKPSGYRSYHVLIRYPLVTSEGRTEVSAEIQIRTMAMNFWATIEHSLKYKYSDNLPDDLQKRLRSAAEASFQLDKEMGKIRGEIVAANRVTQRRNELVDRIMKSIDQLYFSAHIENANDLNRQFIEIFERGNLLELSAFNERLIAMAKMYKVEYE